MATQLINLFRCKKQEGEHILANKMVIQNTVEDKGGVGSDHEKCLI